MTNEAPYVVAIDGPSGSGKGSLALKLARELNFNLLDSGALYRLVAIRALREGRDLDLEAEVVTVLDDFDIRFEAGDELAIPYLDGEDVSSELRQENIGSPA